MNEPHKSPDYAESRGISKTKTASPLAVFAGIMLVAALVRTWRLVTLPVGVFRDEAEKALNGWFLLQDGVDASGRPWPVFIEVFGVTTSAIYQYATLPFLALGGLNEWTARLPAAAVGVATVAFTWMLCRQVCGWKAAAWAAGLLAISPWHVPLSRWAQQGVFLPLLFVLAAWAVARFLAGTGSDALSADEELAKLRRSTATDDGAIAPSTAQERGSPLWLMLAAASIALAMYAYDPARLFAPLLAVAAAVVWWPVWIRRWRAVLMAAVVFFLAASPVLWLLTTQADAAQARFRFLSIFQPNVSMGEAVVAFAGNYISHFSPGFLLFFGDEELRHSGGVGMLNIAEFTFAILGAVAAVRRRSHWGIFMILWILFSPVAASLTRVGVPHALRSQVALPAWQVLAAVGITGAVQWFGPLRRKTVQQVALLTSLVGALPFFMTYFGSYGARSAVNWQYGIKQAIEFFNAAHTKHSTVFFKYVTGAEYLVPFYSRMDRREYLRMLRGQSRYKIVPFGHPDISPEQAAPWQNSRGPAALVSPPGLEWPAGWIPIPVNVPGGEQMPPAMIMYLNEQLMDRIKEQSEL